MEIKVKKIVFLLFMSLTLLIANSKNIYATTNITNLNVGTTSYGSGYLYGQIQSDNDPKITFKSEDGTIAKDVYVEKRQGNTYYFDRHLVEIDLNKQYVFEITNGNNTQILELGNNRTLGTYGDYRVLAKENKIKVEKNTYEGTPTVNLKALNLGTTSYGAKYIYGSIEYTEMCDGTKVNSKVPPIIVFKSTDGTIEKEVYVEKTGTNTYYFDRHLTSLDMSKEYIFEVKSANALNISKEKTNIVLGNRNLGLNTNKYQIYTSNDKVKFVFETYEGIPKVELKDFNLGQTSYNDGYVYGKIKYTENINGKVASATEKPIIVFKSTDGTIEKEVYVEKIGTDTYYFDRHLAGLDLTKEYVFEVKSGEERNSSKETTSINFVAKQIGIYKKYKVLVKDDKLYFEKDLYSATPVTEVQFLKLGNTQDGGTYIYGNIKYTEMCDGQKKEVTENPSFVFKSTDGTVEKEVYVDKIGTDTYYFDRHLDGLDVSKQYIFYAKTQEENNTNKEFVAINLGNNKLGLYKFYTVITQGKEVSLKKERYDGIDVSSWQGDINWKQVASTGIDFTIIRVGYRGYTYGNIMKDSKFEQNIKGAQENRITTGVYFATQAITIEEAAEEARFTLEQISKYNITGPVVIDTESSENDGRADYLPVELRTEIVKEFCEIIKNAGYIPTIYANKYWLTDNLDMSKLNSYDVWLAHYVVGAPEKESDYKGKYSIWQYTSSGKIDGISGFVDLNISYKKY